MEKMSCGATVCKHNMGGICDADVVHVEEWYARDGGSAFCASFRLGQSGANIAHGFLTHAFWQQTQNQGSLVCTLRKCVHNKGGLCAAARVFISRPHPPESSICLCKTFQP